jgi:hypothetical protein
MVAAVFKNSSAGIRHLVSFTNSLKDFALLDDKTILNHRLQLLTVKQLKRVSLVLEADNGQSVAIMQTSQKEALINRLADKLRSTRIVDVVRPQRVLSPVSLKAAFLAALDEQKTFSEFRESLPKDPFQIDFDLDAHSRTLLKQSLQLPGSDCLTYAQTDCSIITTLTSNKPLLKWNGGTWVSALSIICQMDTRQEKKVLEAQAKKVAQQNVRKILKRKVRERFGKSGDTPEKKKNK